MPAKKRNGDHRRAQNTLTATKGCTPDSDNQNHPFTQPEASRAHQDPHANLSPTVARNTGSSSAPQLRATPSSKKAAAAAPKSAPVPGPATSSGQPSKEVELDEMKVDMLKASTSPSTGFSAKEMDDSERVPVVSGEKLNEKTVGEGMENGTAAVVGGKQHHAMNFGDDQGDEPTPEAYNASDKFWALALENVFNLVQLEDPLSGIDAADAPRHARDLGDNIIPIKGGPSWIVILASQFKNAITIVLLIVIIISGIFGDWAEFGVVVFILFFNAFLGFYQEYGAEKSLASLKKMTAGVAKVMRNGIPEIIFIDEVVVGDVIALEQGASVPADCRIFESNGLEVDEALLTGEALPVVKHANVIRDPENRLALGDRKNMVYRNTQVTQGRGKAVVVAGGLNTEMGKLAKRLGDGKSSGKTALMRKLDYMMYFLFLCCAIAALIVFAANGMRYTPATLSYATAVAIAILPESLCAVITVAMTFSVKRMAQQKCIVRKLPVLEVLGNVTDICSDKTGTLTENKMVVKKAVIAIDNAYSVGGAPYDAHGDFFPAMRNGHDQDPVIMAHQQDVRYIYQFFKCAALCSTTVLHLSEDDMDSLAGNGNPTEIAIQVMTWKAGLNRDKLEEEGWECITEYSFDSKIKRMSTAWENKETRELYLCTKGAPERVIELCTYKISEDGRLVNLTQEDRQHVDQHIRDLAAQGLRTICFAYREDATKLFPIPADVPFIDAYARDQVECDLVFLGIVGIYDPPRPESRPSVVACQHAGICVRMLTGDHTSTAGSIASMLNIIRRRDLDDPVKLQAGPDFDKIDPETIDGWADLPVVVGRCSPESKVKMIESLHRRKKVVAMTGDGFNDSPSIKIADIGCAMGSGVDVTKGVADLVITDDNFATIVKAVAEGRRISQCIRKFVVHLLSSNVAEVIALICGLPIRHGGESVFILSPIEILWLNMFTSAPPATGLSLDKATDDILQVPPNTQGFFTVELITDTIVYGFWLGAMTLCGFVVTLYGLKSGPEGEDCNRHNGVGCANIWTARSTAFGILYFGLLIHSYTVRHPRVSVFRMHLFDNKWIFGSCIFGGLLFVPIVYINAIAHDLFVHSMITWEWGVIVIGVIAFLAICEIYKVLKNLLFPIRKVLVDVDEDAEDVEEQRQREYKTFTRTMPDDRSVETIASENLRMSFASLAGSVATANTGSFRMPAQRQKKKRSGLFRRRQ
ncbi:calcium motive p-type ATPase, putative [Leishmania tarentolae]|uniref:Calcium motive p-type ATPase, putative n=1 Tax=Leishmania tarentolae TaxID=5689 RepID=A0A640KTX9_LEITA|nr:calcium motive p-type ATPase, putative [Leishmania tarentolae]